MHCFSFIFTIVSILLSQKCATFAGIMDRRHFCKIASLAAGALGLGSLPALASSTEDQKQSTSAGLSLMPRPGCRLTVLRRECHNDLQALFLDDPETGPCSLFRSGDEFRFGTGDSCPDNFCPRLWESLCSTLGRDSCTAALKENTLILACPDGTRPVIVRIDI